MDKKKVSIVNDLKSFKSLSTKKKCMYIGIVIVILIVAIITFSNSKESVITNNANVSEDSNNSLQLQEEILKIAKQEESSAWKYNTFQQYKTLSNGNIVILFEYQATYGYEKYYLLAEFNGETGKYITKTDVFPATDSSTIKLMYSTKWD